MTYCLKVFWLACFMILFGAVGGYGAEDAPSDGPAPYVAVGKVTEVQRVETGRYVGHLIPVSRVDLVTRVSGKLMRMGFAGGETVSEGQVLYELDDTRYAAEVAAIQAQIAELEAKREYAELKYSRASGLYESKADTKDSMDSARSEYKAVEASILAAEAQLVKARDDLKNTKISAPVSGKVGLSEYTPGNYLTPDSGILATLIQLDPIRVGFAISNKEFLALFGTEENLKKHTRIRARLADDSIYEREGTIEFLDNRANRKTDAIKIFVRFDNPEGKLVPDSAVTVLLARSNGVRQAAVIPSAIMHDSKSPYVYVVNSENRVEKREVTLDGGSADLQGIGSGLQPGEVVIVDGMHKTLPGGKVEIEYRDMVTASRNTR